MGGRLGQAVRRFGEARCAARAPPSASEEGAHPTHGGDSTSTSEYNDPWAANGDWWKEAPEWQQGWHWKDGCGSWRD